MSAVISSAQPLKLYRYSDVSTGMDQDLMSEANHLSGILRHFESRCTEYSVRVSYLADSLRDHARTAEGVDRWVRTVGLGFEHADRGHVVTLALQGQGVFSAQAAGVIARLNPLTSFTQRWSLWLQFKETDWALNVALWRIRYLIFRLQYAPWLDLVRMPWDLYEKYRPMFAGALIAGSIRVGHAYAGQIIINLPNFLTHFGFSLREIRTWAGLSSHLNHIKYTRLPTHMFWVSLAVSIPSLVSKWGSDIQDYAGGKYSGTELASAITVDTALTLAPVGTTYVGSLAGLKIGALIGTAIAPGVGTAIGGAVGAIAGGILAGWATTEVIERTDIREKAIPWLDEHVFGPVAGAISSGINTVSGWVDDAAQSLRQKIKNTTDTLQEIQNRMIVESFKEGYDHPIPRMLIEHYAYADGSPLGLSVAEMEQLGVPVDITRFPEFSDVIQELGRNGGGTKPIKFSGPGVATTHGTLGHFTITCTGQLTVTSDSDGNLSWKFDGEMSFIDRYDFDPKEWGERSLYAEVLTRMGATFLPGEPFDITSDSTPMSQSSSDSEAVWAGTGVEGTPSRLSAIKTDDILGANNTEQKVPESNRNLEQNL